MFTGYEVLALLLCGGALAHAPLTRYAQKLNTQVQRCGGAVPVDPQKWRSDESDSCAALENGLAAAPKLIIAAHGVSDDRGRLPGKIRKNTSQSHHRRTSGRSLPGNTVRAG